MKNYVKDKEDPIPYCRRTGWLQGYSGGLGEAGSWRQGQMVCIIPDSSVNPAVLLEEEWEKLAKLRLQILNRVHCHEEKYNIVHIRGEAEHNFTASSKIQRLSR